MADNSQGAQTGDNGIGVPPFRPAPQPIPPQMGGVNGVGVAKDMQMARAPFAAPGGNPPMPGGPAAPAMRPAAPVARPARNDAAGDRRTLVVGRGISLQGMVQDAERLVVEGQVEASMIHATELAVSPGGIFKGEIEVEDAEVAGTIDGTITARGNLIVRNTGVVLGTARCRRLQVEDGGQITGRIEMINETRARAPDHAPRAPAAAEA